MPPNQQQDDTTNTNTAVTHVEEPKDDAERQQQKKDEEAGFAGGFAEQRGQEKPAAAAINDTTNASGAAAADASLASGEDAAAKQRADEEAKRVKDEAERKAKEEVEAKRWEGVPVAVKEFIESQTQATTQITQRLKSVEGRAGAALSGVEALKGAVDAASAASKAGQAAPSKEQIAAATKNTEKWTQLKEDFPAWADAMEEQFAAMRADIAKGSGAGVDVSKVRDEVVKDVDGRISASMAAAVREARALGRLDSQYPGWEETVKSKEFFAWSYTGGPTADEQAAYFELRGSDPDKAATMFKDFSKTYPTWWGEKGARMASENPTHATELLKSYAGHVTAQRAKAEAERLKKERLEHAAPATRGAGGATRTIESEESGFEAGFKAVRTGG